MCYSCGLVQLGSGHGINLQLLPQSRQGSINEVFPPNTFSGIALAFLRTPSRRTVFAASSKWTGLLSGWCSGAWNQKPARDDFDQRDEASRRLRPTRHHFDKAWLEDAILTLARWHDTVSAWDPRRVEAMRVPCQSEWVGIIRQIKARLRI